MSVVLQKPLQSVWINHLTKSSKIQQELKTNQMK